MKKILALALVAIMAFALVSCGTEPAVTTEAPVVTTEAPVETTEAPVENAAMSYAEYAAADLDTPVVVEAYVQAHQSWWDNKVTVYAADEDGAYFIYEMACSEEDAEKLVPGTKILVTGFLSVCVLAGAVVYSFAKAVIPALGGIDAFDLALLAFSVVAMLYYLTIGKKAPFRSLLCIASSLVLLVIVLDLYFDRTVSYTNHSVVLCFATAIFSALTFAAEANFSLGRSAYKRYLSYVSTAITLSFALSVPDIVYFAVSKTAVIADIYFDVIILAFGIYHLARLIEIALYKEEK